MSEFVKQGGYLGLRGVPHVWSYLEQPGTLELNGSSLLGKPNQSRGCAKEGATCIERNGLGFAPSLQNRRNVWIDEGPAGGAIDSFDHVVDAFRVHCERQRAERVRRVGFKLSEPSGAGVVAIENLQDFGARRSDGLTVLAK